LCSSSVRFWRPSRRTSVSAPSSRIVSNKQWVLAHPKTNCLLLRLVPDTRHVGDFRYYDGSKSKLFKDWLYVSKLSVGKTSNRSLDVRRGWKTQCSGYLTNRNGKRDR